MTTEEMVMRLDRTIRALAKATTGTRPAIVAALQRGIAGADERRAEIEQWLIDRDAWFWKNLTHPKHEQRTDEWIVKVREYETIWDVGMRATRSLSFKERTDAA